MPSPINMPVGVRLGTGAVTGRAGTMVELVNVGKRVVFDVAEASMRLGVTIGPKSCTRLGGTAAAVSGLA